ncbi:alkaline phosphatase D family protein [Nocardioides sp. ChNu-153]|uniref:alkaline phosphatase D family protein n=1 Tax=unclassified Nocardioides TaxID=2615069 RepID=UPI002406F0BA|nr:MULTISPECIES: alkaline phosphatase D family protein [unclassified Nocardioides]MDF9716001.1 alkaline phosphatase D family protein [Nocardioides sp. ChNu-99]MDN7119969.1 alkaline phosphatase D family protein [Nocardioides sp. ChNu-153]
MHSSRRTLLGAGAVVAPTLLVPSVAPAVLPPAAAADSRRTAAAPTLGADPFTLGVASGDPAADGFVLWTRLAPEPLAADGAGGMPSRRYQVAWEVAADPGFRRVVRRGQVSAGPESAHAVHVEVRGLAAGREYWYRFRTGARGAAHVSGVGRAVTAPAPWALPRQLRMAFASCSNFPVGWFTAYRHLAEEQPDLVLHLGDYQYEGAANPAHLRPHAGPETTTLAGYRQRLAQYRTDPDLQAAHAAAPWLVVWDDHEVDNNYAALVSEKPAEQAVFAERRAAAYRAYYENMPLRRTSVPRGPGMQLFRRVSWGRLATFHMLDTRQYRSDQAQGDGWKAPGGGYDDPTRSLPGLAQERWLLDGLRASGARWDVLGQQVFFGGRRNATGAATTVSMDSWDGYPASRQRISQGFLDARVRNPVVLTGDVHAHWASDLYLDYDEPTTPIGSEFVTTSITSGGDGYDDPTGTHPWMPDNPNIRFWTNLRGYVSTTIEPDAMRVDHRCVPVVTTPDAQAFTRRSYVVEDRVRGMQQVADAPLAAAAGARARRALPSDEQVVRDTVREETGY